MAEEKSLYHLDNIDHGYGKFRLIIPDFTIHRGVSLGLSGPNGSGKSTLLRLLAFLENPDKGTVSYSPVTGNGREVTLLHQDPYLLKRSVFDNISYGLRIRGDKKDIRQRVHRALETVNLNPEKFADRWWNELSGGEAQRVALASRIILRPDVLLLDEPVANVDTESASAISTAVNRMREDFGTTLIISSHDMSWLTDVTDEVWKVHNGRLTGTGNVNIIQGPWYENEHCIWYSEFTEGVKIFATRPPEKNSVAVLSPQEIMISSHDQPDLSALNRIEATVKLMVAEEPEGRIRLEADIAGKILNVYITEASAQNMNILPGKKIFLIFKATSLEW